MPEYPASPSWKFSSLIIYSAVERSYQKQIIFNLFVNNPMSSAAQTLPGTNFRTLGPENLIGRPALVPLRCGTTKSRP